MQQPIVDELHDDLLFLECENMLVKSVKFQKDKIIECFKKQEALDEIRGELTDGLNIVIIY